MKMLSVNPFFGIFFFGLFLTLFLNFEFFFFYSTFISTLVAVVRCLSHSQKKERKIVNRSSGSSRRRSSRFRVFCKCFFRVLETPIPRDNGTENGSSHSYARDIEHGMMGWRGGWGIFAFYFTPRAPVNGLKTIFSPSSSAILRYYIIMFRRRRLHTTHAGVIRCVSVVVRQCFPMFFLFHRSLFVFENLEIFQKSNRCPFSYYYL